jgi:hypothetical protein
MLDVPNFEFLNTLTLVHTDATFQGTVILSFNYDPNLTLKWKIHSESST